MLAGVLQLLSITVVTLQGLTELLFTEVKEKHACLSNKIHVKHECEGIYVQAEGKCT